MSEKNHKTELASGRLAVGVDLLVNYKRLLQEYWKNLHDKNLERVKVWKHNDKVDIAIWASKKFGKKLKLPQQETSNITKNQKELGKEKYNDLGY